MKEARLRPLPNPAFDDLPLQASQRDKLAESDGIPKTLAAAVYLNDAARSDADNGHMELDPSVMSSSALHSFDSEFFNVKLKYNGFAIFLFPQVVVAEELPHWDEMRGGCSAELEGIPGCSEELRKFWGAVPRSCSAELKEGAVPRSSKKVLKASSQVPAFCLLQDLDMIQTAQLLLCLSFA
jgi:hypothetical protein